MLHLQQQAFEKTPHQHHQHSASNNKIRLNHTKYLTMCSFPESVTRTEHVSIRFVQHDKVTNKITLHFSS